MKKYGIGARLLACASLIREGAVVADVGTDHAYLPIHLLEEGKIERAVLADINEGPLAVARENAEACGFSERVSLHLCNGAAALADTGATDYAICGMGGELIADIIDKAPHLKDGGISLVLQPMSRKNVLRTYLSENGFEIKKEVFSTEDGKHYVSILASYTGERVELSPIDAELGKESVQVHAKERTEYFRHLKDVLLRAAVGKARGGEDTSLERMLIGEIESRFKVDEEKL